MSQHITIWVTLVLIVIILWNAQPAEITYVTSDIDGRSYLVRDLPDKIQAANHLAALRVKLDRFIRDLNIKSGYHVVVSEGYDAKYTSYTVNKHNIYMCLRERGGDNKLIDSNTLFFVALHELSHVITPSIGHTEEFWNNFRMLLQHAIKGGYYQYHPYHRDPKKYCGIVISDTPIKNDMP